MIRPRSVLLFACVVCLAMACGCSCSRGLNQLSFSDLSVSTETHTGFFGGRYASFEVTGSITNDTGKPVNADNLPLVSWDGGKAKAKMSQDKLLAKETCNVSWKGELTIKDNTLPELSFTGSVDCVGLDECEAELNEQLQAIVAEYVAADAEKEAEKEAEKKAKAEEKQKREDDKKALMACEGKTASEAYEVASKTAFEPKFFDSAGIDVTEGVSEKSDAGKATVSKVDITEAGWFSSDRVDFTLDFDSPSTKAKKEAKEKLSALEGKSAAEAYELLKDSGLDYRFEDQSGNDITADVKDDFYTGARERARVVGVASTDSFAKITIDRCLAIAPEDNGELDSILKVQDEFDSSIGAFASKYAGRRIEFDGCIAYLNNHGTAKTRYDILILPMDYSPDSSIGPNFQFSDVAPTSFKWRGEKPDSISTGMNLHFVVRIGRFDENSGLFRVDPIELSMR